MQHFHEISPLDITDNFIRAIGQEWMLITAGDASRCNTMTASWGFVGQIWGHPAAMVVIRPTRHTRQFVEANERLTLSFFDERYRDALRYCGSHSGREGDKFAASGLTVVRADAGTPAVGEARLVLECRKMYVGRFEAEGFLQKELLERMYPDHDLHYCYIVQIEHALVRCAE